MGAVFCPLFIILHLENNPSEKIHLSIVRLAIYTALASSLHILETFIPKPLPFLRIGLSNIVILLLIYEKAYFQAFIVLISKTFVGGLLTGTIFTPTTLLSLSGGILAFSGMLSLYKLNVFSISGLSIVGAVLHNLGQLISVRLLIIKNDSVIKLIPLLIILGLLTGLFNGLITQQIFNSLITRENKNKKNNVI